VEEHRTMNTENFTGLEIVVIGMSGRFPHAKNIDEFWHNLKEGSESVIFYSDEELIEAGGSPDLVKDPNYVKTSGSFLDRKEYFDAAFFGYKPVEAELMDPQTRVFLETSWHALEDAGYDPGSFDGLIGLYAGSKWNFSWEARSFLSGRTRALGEFASSLLFSRDSLCTLVSYNLGLKGPAVFIKTACSTSLVAVHLACQAILSGECDMALAGGVSISNFEKSGYLYQEGMISSPDGHCRAFDAEARGTVGGDGVGVVVLKRLEDAVAHGDHIHAVIKGTAVNNDGSRKIGYTAPSITGQVEVIREALHVAEVDPETITYIETHGTGTPVGDPIEIEALKTAFKTDKKGYCRIGSLKTNIGHLDAAAGIASVIKVILALKHRMIPPNLHFQAPNPKIDFENSPFRVNAILTEWETEGYPLRAGVSSFGIGGTNVHAILEEWPDNARGNGQRIVSRPGGLEECPQLILLSTKTETALDKMTENLATYLKENPGPILADLGYTLQVGRKAFKHRKMLVCSTVDEAIEALSSDSPDSRKVRTAVSKDEDRSVVFMFSGLGAQYVNMGHELYEKELLFREEMDRCFEILSTQGDYDLKEILYPGNAPQRTQSAQIKEFYNKTSAASAVSAVKIELPDIDQFEIAQLVVFVFEYALAKLLIKWGIQPRAMIGYSFGEYTAACIAGVLSLEDALNLVVLRGQLIREIPGGAMLSVPLAEKELLPLLKTFNAGFNGSFPLSLAIDNGPSCIVSGPVDQVEAFEQWMKEKRCVCVPLNALHAIHSSMMEPILKKFQEKVSGFTLQKPGIPYISNVTGRWITAEESTFPGYWAAHLRGTVRFADGVRELTGKIEDGKPASIFLEIGPGYDLCTLVRHHFDQPASPLILNLVPGASTQTPGKKTTSTSDTRYLLTRLGRLWLSGIEIDWSQFHDGEERHRIPLPLYPFDSQRYWFDGDFPGKSGGMAMEMNRLAKEPDIADWFYIPSWKRSVLPGRKRDKKEEKVGWLVFVDDLGLGDRLVKRLEQEGQGVIQVRSGAAFTKTNDSEYIIDPHHADDYDTLFDQLSCQNKMPDRIVHFWSVTRKEKGIDEIQDMGFYSLFYLARAVGKYSFKDSKSITIIVVSNHLHRVTSEEKLYPEKATLLGAVKVIPKEYFNITCRSIDIVFPEPGSQKPDYLIDQILTEFSIEPSAAGVDVVVAYRGDYRWVQVFEPLRMEMETENGKEEVPRLKEEGVYLITGGLGGIGLVLAQHLADTVRARLILTRRSAFPQRKEWDRWLTAHPEDDPVSRKIEKLHELESAGAEVLVCSADAADRDQMQAVVVKAEERFGRIDGVIHAAGLPDGGVIPLRTRETIEPILAPKVKGTLVLDQVLKERNITLDFFVLFSSISAVLGLFGQVAYCAANAFLDAFSYHKTYEDGVFTVSINWDFWQEVGMGVETIRQLEKTANITDGDLLLKNGILSSEGISVFSRILNGLHPQVIVSAQDLAARFAYVDYFDTSETSDSQEAVEMQPVKGKLYPRPELTTEYVAPESEFEETFADILQRSFGFEQVGIDDNLFEYGITSLDMIHINNALRKKIKKEIPIVVMFEYPTIHSLGRYLEEEEARSSGEVEGRTGQIEDLDKVEDLLYSTIDIFREQE
jgi:acyl transferase domain-containing protein/acyl carrier protein